MKVLFSGNYDSPRRVAPLWMVSKCVDVLLRLTFLDQVLKRNEKVSAKSGFFSV